MDAAVLLQVFYTWICDHRNKGLILLPLLFNEFI